jgi:PilZ domain
MGSARTIDVSSSGLSFPSDKPLFIGQRLEVSLDWPVLLHGDIKLQLVLSGVVVRRDGPVVALKIREHDFRTRC